MSKQSSDYKLGRETWAEAADLKNFARLGRDVFKMDGEDIAGAMKDATKTEKRAFRTGVRNAMLKKMNDSAWTTNLARRIFKGPGMARQLKQAFEPKEYEAFKRSINAEMMMRASQEQALGGSNTARIQQDLAKRLSLNPADFLDLLSGSALTGAARTVRKVSDVLGLNMREKTAAKLAKDLYNRDLDAQLALVRGAVKSGQPPAGLLGAQTPARPLAEIVPAAAAGGGAGGLLQDQ